MNLSEVIINILVLFIALASFVISGFQFAQKGFLFHNTSLYASKKERETMDKKPHYRQSAIVFLLLGVIFLLLAIELFCEIKWLYMIVILVVIALIIYAIASSISIERKK